MGPQYITIQQAVSAIKELIEKAITEGGYEAKNNLIRTSVPIGLLHDVIKAELINNGVNSHLIHPEYKQSKGELGLCGFFKKKNQDICVIPNNRHRNPEIIHFDGILKGEECDFGYDLTEAILSINVRSQLSSIAKNFDTLYERTFAEALNLHLRCQKMVLGEFYMIPVYPYDDKLALKNRVAFIENRNISKQIEKYLLAFYNTPHFLYQRWGLLSYTFIVLSGLFSDRFLISFIGSLFDRLVSFLIVIFDIISNSFKKF